MSGKTDPSRKVELIIPTRTYLRILGLTVATIVLIYAAIKASHALTLIFTAFFLALALNAPVHWLSEHLPGKMRGSRSFATSISYLIVVLAFIGFIASIAPPLIRQTSTFVNQAPAIVRDFKSQDSSTGRFIRRYKLEDDFNRFSNQLSSRVKNSGGEAFAAVQKIGSSAFSLLTILVLTFMMLVEGPRWLKFFNEIMPDDKQERSDHILMSMYKVIKGYVNGQVLLAALASLLIMPMILALNIGYPVALMVIVFICGLIPMIGHTIGAIIVTTVALFHSIPAAIIILAYYILYQQFENVFVQPRIQANSTNMSPLLVFSAVVVGLSFGGIIAGLVAIPVAGCIRIAILEYLRSKKIIDEPEFKLVTGSTK